MTIRNILAWNHQSNSLRPTSSAWYRRRLPSRHTSRIGRWKYTSIDPFTSGCYPNLEKQLNVSHVQDARNGNGTFIMVAEKRLTWKIWPCEGQVISERGLVGAPEKPIFGDLITCCNTVGLVLTRLSAFGSVKECNRILT